MKIAWVSPLARRSAIGYYSTIVAEALRAQGHEVVLVKCDVPPAPAGGPDNVPDAGADTGFASGNFAYDMDIHAFRAAPPDGLDGIFYNVGNEYTNHGTLLEPGLPPGTMILHDVCYPHLFFGYCIHHDLDPLSMLTALSRLGLVPEAYREIFDSAMATTNPDEVLTRLAPLDMVAWVGHRAIRLIVHSSSVVPRIAQATGLPTVHMPLAYWTDEKTRAVRALPAAKAQAATKTRPAKLTLSSFGHLTANKRVPSLIAALGADADLAAAWQIRIIGPSDLPVEAHYRQLAASQPHDVDIHFSGEVSDAQFEIEMRRATSISSLRYPSYESGSATLALALATNGDVFATAQGSSTDDVRDLVRVIDVHNEVGELRTHLRAIQSGARRSEAELTGIRTEARRIFDADAYARRIAEIVKAETGPSDPGSAKNPAHTPAGEPAGDLPLLNAMLIRDTQYSLALRRWGPEALRAAARRAERVLKDLGEAKE